MVKSFIKANEGNAALKADFAKAVATFTTEEIRAQLAELVNDVAGVPVEDVQLDKSFVDDLDVDSLAMVEIIVGCEEKFGVTIPDEESKNLKTVGDAVAYVEQHS